jgi:hypothetical protein
VNHNVSESCQGLEVSDELGLEARVTAQHTDRFR